MKVTPKGRKVFLVMYRLAGAGSRLRKYTIGPYGRVTLPMAKAQAKRAIDQLCGISGWRLHDLRRTRRRPQLKLSVRCLISQVHCLVIRTLG